MSQQNEISKTLKIREVTEPDVSFVFNSWLKSHRHSDSTRGISSPVYYAGHHRLIERIILQSKVLIACNKDDESQIYGYICAGHVDGILAVHYIYIKQTYRNLGIGKELLNQFQHDFATASCYTHKNRMSDLLAEKYNMVYHPYLTMELYGKPDEPARIAINQLAEQNVNLVNAGIEKGTQAQEQK